MPSVSQDATTDVPAPSEALLTVSCAADASDRPATPTMASAMAADLRPFEDFWVARAVVAMAVPSQDASSTVRGVAQWVTVELDCTHSTPQHRMRAHPAQIMTRDPRGICGQISMSHTDEGAAAVDRLSLIHIS